MRDLLDICESKHGGNVQSQAAFRRAKPKLSRSREAVLACIRDSGREGMTCKEIAARLGKGMNAVSGRCTEILADGLIVDSCRRRDGGRVLVAREVMFGVEK